jgi:uncharacterized repeat protein (TIGR01451 family)
MRTCQAMPLKRVFWAIILLLTALGASQPCRAEHLVDTITGVFREVYSNAGPGQQVATAFHLRDVSRLASVTWIGGYYSADVMPAAPVRFVFQLHQSEGTRPAATPLVSLNLQAESRLSEYSFSSSFCQSERCTWYAYHSPLPAIELPAGNYWILLAEADERTIRQGTSQWLWAEGDIPGDVATRKGDDGEWLPQSRGTMQFALGGISGLDTTSGLYPTLLLEKTVDNATPALWESVEFTLRVTNLGSTAVSDVRVEEHLPSDLQIPPGTAPAAEQGVYDMNSHQWFLGDLVSEAQTNLRLPAIITDASASTCVTNRASLSQADNPATLGEATATLSGPEVDECVDIGVHIVAADYSGTICNLTGAYRVTIAVQNSGPDIARNVNVNIEQRPIIAPNLRFADCHGIDNTHCLLTELASGESVQLIVVSDNFVNQVATEQTLTVTTNSIGEDYTPENNQTSRRWEVPNVSCDWCDDCVSDYSGGDWNDDSMAPACFIATAAYGSWLDPHVAALRQFRDQYLMPHAAGRALVHLYYRHSPPLADYIAPRPWLRATVRVLLVPIVWAVQYPLLALLLLLLSGSAALLVSIRRSR